MQLHATLRNLYRAKKLVIHKMGNQQKTSCSFEKIVGTDKHLITGVLCGSNEIIHGVL